MASEHDETPKNTQTAQEAEPVKQAPQPTDELETLKQLAGLGTLVGGIAHKLNNPLMGVVNHISYAKMKVASEPAKTEEALETALKYTRRCVAIVEELLPFARPGIGGLMPPSISADVVATVARSIEAAYDRLDRTGATVDSAFADNMAEVGLQQSLLQQILVELITNACRAMDGREHRILDISAVTAPSFVTIQVTDTGAGMEKEVLDHAFDPLFAAGENHGSGIGLAMCRSIVESVGGTIGAKSKPEHGTAITMALPVHQALKH